MRSSITDEMVSDVVRMYTDAVSTNEISNKLNISKTTAYAILKKAGIELKRPTKPYAKLTREDRNAIRDRYVSGEKFDDIISSTGYSRGTVYQCVRNLERRISASIDEDHPGLKKCSSCGEWMDESCFYNDTRTISKLSARCKKCIQADREYRKSSNPAKFICAQLKGGAKARGISFSLKPEDIEFPDTCPILGIKLEFNKGQARDNSPSIDRINSSLGYEKDNIIVISHRANSIKRDATVCELLAIADFYKNLDIVKHL